MNQSIIRINLHSTLDREKSSEGNHLISKSKAFQSVGAIFLQIGRTHNKQRSKDVRVRTVVLLAFTLVKSHKNTGVSKVKLKKLCLTNAILPKQG